MANIVQQPDPAPGCDAFMGRWSRKLAPQFAAWLAVPPQSRWLNVGRARLARA